MIVDMYDLMFDSLDIIVYLCWNIWFNVDLLLWGENVETRPPGKTNNLQNITHPLMAFFTTGDMLLIIIYTPLKTCYF
jgi:hypothetical protein